MKILTITFLLLYLLSSTLVADDFSQWRGPNRDGKYPDTNLLTQWPENGPDLVWSTTGFGEGHSSPAVTSHGIYLTGMINGTGYLFALEKNGKLLCIVFCGQFEIPL